MSYYNVDNCPICKAKLKDEVIKGTLKEKPCSKCNWGVWKDGSREGYYKLQREEIFKTESWKV